MAREHDFCPEHSGLTQTIRDGFRNLGEKVEDLAGCIKDIKNRLFVDGDQPAVMTRIDRLEQKEKRREKLFWIAAAAVIVLVVNQAWGIWIKITTLANAQ